MDNPTSEWEALARRGIAHPTDEEDAERRLGLLLYEVESIHGQLASRRPVGRVSNDEWLEYTAWKRGAAAALRWKGQEVAALKRWLHAQRNRNDIPVSPEVLLNRRASDRRHLARCVHVLGEVEEFLDVTGQAILASARQHLDATSSTALAEQSR